ncbi:secretion/conjugation apparatus DotM-related subunit [Vibrio coralliilyticus]|uniref:secretion/conjugation apparatus DotM-related subunit n=1 Tax=Vibrio coralliilyticus TaxID=190893 RepID=UPI001E525D68|nr:hypothetical protein [Vibrio coralliilyticus]MCC2524970.1 hypothetical protein [Vibrio coralliilyticus]
MSRSNNDDIETALFGGFWYYGSLAVICLLLFNFYEAYLFAFWKWGRMAELYFWYWLTSPFDSTFFLEGINVLRTIAPNEMNWSWLFEFEAYFNQYLRFFYAPFFFIVAGKLFHNYWTVTEPLNVQTMIELYAKESKANEVLVYDNPLKHHLVYDFDNRSDYHNRHAQGMQPNQYLTANPPPNASRSELEKHKRLVSSGKDSIFQPIALIDRKNNRFNFSRERAKRSYERQLTNPPVNSPFYLDEENAPRLFDQDGQLIPLQKDDKGRIVGGFATNKLLNNGREFKGAASDVALLFNHIERNVYFELCSRYRHPSVPLEKLVIELTKQHAYTRTYLVSLLNIVRANEPIGSSEFYLLWRQDRILYFSMYSASEEKPFWEANGVMAHYHFEIKLGKAITTPQVITAVDALEKEYQRLKRHEPDFQDILTRLTHGMSNEGFLTSTDQIDSVSLEGELDILNDIDANSTGAGTGSRENANSLDSAHRDIGEL